jgi:3-methyladenine DNA glycosylase AlkD
MTCDEVMAELKKLGSEQTKKTLLRHGVKEPFYGVKIGDMKPIVKRAKNDNTLALALYDTGNYDAMYLAGLVADPKAMTKANIQKWAKTATSEALCNYTVAWIAAESPFGWELAAEWIESPKEPIATAGWSTYSGLVALVPDDELDLKLLQKLLDRVKAKIQAAPNRVKYCMNTFIISVGGYVAPLTAKAKAAAKAIGTVEVDVGDTDCKVPDAVSYIEKMEARGTPGTKRKTVRC